MRFHVVKRYLENLWKRKVVRAVAVTVVVVATVVVQSWLSNRPEPIDLASSKIPEIFGGQKLIVQAGGANTELIISHTGKVTEEVDLHFSKARLGPPTLLDFEETHPPRTASEIHCSPTNWLDQNSAKPAQPALGKPKPCSTSLTIAPSTQNAIQLAFFQTDTNGREQYRHIVTETGNSEAKVKVKLVPRLAPPSADAAKTNTDDDSQVDCGRYLTVGTWQQLIGGATQIETEMESGSSLRSRFTTLDGTLWKGADGYFEPFTLRSQQVGNAGSATPLKASLVLIESMDGKQTVFSANSADDSLIRIDNLRVGTDRLQVALDGSAYVALNGELMSESILKRIEKYPLIAAALGALNLAILAWSIKIVKSLF